MHTHASLARAFEAQYRSLISLVRRKTRCADAAADIVQDAFIRIATLKTPQHVLQPQAFFRRVVENLVIDRFRERRLIPAHLSTAPPEPGVASESVVQSDGSPQTDSRCHFGLTSSDSDPHRGSHHDRDECDPRLGNTSAGVTSIGPDDFLQAVQTAAALQRIVDGLPPRCREVFILRKVDGLTHEEIGQRLGITQNMVEKHLRRALLAFQSGRDAQGTQA